MSTKEYPVHVIDSDEDPSEYDYDSDDTSVYENLPTNPRMTPDDDSNDTPPILPPTIPCAAPGVAETWNIYAGTARGPYTRTTARMTTGRLPFGPLAPRDRTPASLEDLLAEPSPKRQRTEHLSWMPSVLAHWRALGGIPSTHKIGESSRSPLSHPLTGEPMEQTIPTLVAITNSHVGSLAETRAYILELQSDTSRLDGDMISTYERLETAENLMTMDRETSQATAARVEMLEGRARAAEIIAGASLLMTTLMTAVGMYLAYLH